MEHQSATKNAKRSAMSAAAWSTLVAAAANILFVVLTYLNLRELQVANDLERQQQNLSMRPYMALQGGTHTKQYLRGQADEYWQVSVVLENVGQLPARGLIAEAWFDTVEANTEVPPPARFGSLVGRGSTSGIELGAGIPRNDIVAWLGRNQSVVLHGNVWYRDHNDSARVFKFASRLEYLNRPAVRADLPGVLSDTLTWTCINQDAT